jgi:hypothetical protein
LYCCTNSLSMKHVDAWESRSVWASIIQAYYIWQWLVLRKMALDLKVGYDHFHYLMHQGLTSQSLLRLDMFIFWLLWSWIGKRAVTCCMWTTLLWTFTSNMIWFSTIQTKIIGTLTLFFLLHQGLEACLITLCQNVVSMIRTCCNYCPKLSCSCKWTWVVIILTTIVIIVNLQIWLWLQLEVVMITNMTTELM